MSSSSASGAATRRRRPISPASTARRRTPSIDALIADVDAVAIALPPDVQAPIALRAARAGRHLLLDKPVALVTGMAAEIAAAVAEP